MCLSRLFSCSHAVENICSCAHDKKREQLILYCHMFGCHLWFMYLQLCAFCECLAINMPPLRGDCTRDPAQASAETSWNSNIQGRQCTVFDFIRHLPCLHLLSRCCSFVILCIGLHIVSFLIVCELIIFICMYRCDSNYV